ncbi:MAG: NTP/NDP exchange transporter [Sandaracinaceae bacterium]
MTQGRRAPSPVERFLGLFAEVRRGEGGTVLIMLATIFVLLACYYILKTVREPLVLASAPADLALLQQATWLSQDIRQVLIDFDTNGAQLKAIAAAGQAILLLGFVPAYSWLASRVSRVSLIVGVTLFFIANIELFFFLRILGVPLLGFFFYIWVGIFSVALIAQFWSFANDLYTEEQGKRLFPIIGIGATAGSPLGSIIATIVASYIAPGGEGGAAPALDPLQRFVRDLEVDPAFILLQVPALVLLLFMALMIWAARRDAVVDPEGEAPERAGTPDDTDAEPAAEGTGVAKDEAIGGRSGFALMLASPYIGLIAGVILVLNLVNTTGEFMLSDLVVRTGQAAVEAGTARDLGLFINNFYGNFFFYVNIIAFVLQAFVVSRIAKYLGLPGVLLVLPCIALGAYGLFALGLGLAVVRWAKTAENSTDYSIMNTGKAMVWLPTSRGAKYKAKQAIDTFVVRAGDVVAAVLFIAGTTVWQLGLPGLAAINLVFVGVWLLLTFALLRRYRRITDDPAIDPLATGHEPPPAGLPEAAAA